MYEHSFFDAPLDRTHTDCEKWDGIRREHGADVLPMWVADMDFRCAHEIVQALVHRAGHPAYGYTEESQASVEAMLGFIKRRHGLTLDKDQQLMLPCVVTGLKAAVRAFTQPGDAIIIQPPVYGPFFYSIQDNDRAIVENPLVMDENSRYTMNFEELELLCQKGAKLMMLCNPHNPVGRCWTKEELERLTDILGRYNIPLLSDEIHWDFVYEKGAFTSALALPAAQGPTAQIFTFTSASKTFNLAGLQQAVMLSRNGEMLKALATDMRNAGVTQGNIFALTASHAAYQYGDTWLDSLLAYLDEARAILRQELAQRLPQAIMSPMEATYLAWVDLRAYGFTTQELMDRCYANGVAFTSGTFFGEKAGEGFLRINLACPHSQIRQAVCRLETAVKA